MEAKNTLWHINWGDGDDFYIVAPDKETAIKGMPEGKDMINYMVRLDCVAHTLYKTGRESMLKEVKEWVNHYLMLPELPELREDNFQKVFIPQWQAFLKEKE
jgi:hypothetical protein